MRSLAKWLVSVGGVCYDYSMNNNKNLPANAVSTSKVVAGMRITRPYDVTGTVYTVTADATMFSGKVFVQTDKGTLRVAPGGTFRLA